MTGIGPTSIGNRREELDALGRLVRMNQRLVLISLALGLVVLALGGWFVQAVLWPSRTLAASVR